MVICLERGADLHMAQLMPLPLIASVKSSLVLPFWYRLIRVVPDKGPFSGCVCCIWCSYVDVIIVEVFMQVCYTAHVFQQLGDALLFWVVWCVAV